MKPWLSVNLKSARDREKVTVNRDGQMGNNASQRVCIEDLTLLRPQVPSIDKGKVSVTQVGGKATNENTASRRQHFKMRDLPEGMERSFSDKLLPRIRKLTGQLPAWNLPSIEDIQRLMDEIFPNYAKMYCVQDGDVFCKLVSLVNCCPLVSDCEVDSQVTVNLEPQVTA